MGNSINAQVLQPAPDVQDPAQNIPSVPASNSSGEFRLAAGPYRLIRTVNGNVLLTNQPLAGERVSVEIPPNGELNISMPQQSVNPVNNPRSRSRSPINRSSDPLEKKVGSRSMTVHEMNRIPRIYRKDLKADETECGICYEGYKDRRIIRRLKCSHAYHQICIFAWLKKDSTCPFCRLNLVDEPADKNNNDNNDQNGRPGLSSRN